jgi:hypothetical protein
MLQQIMQRAMSQNLQGNPIFGMYQQMMQGKSSSEQLQTLLNLAKSRGVAENKIFSEEDLKTLGLR